MRLWWPKEPNTVICSTLDKSYQRRNIQLLPADCHPLPQASLFFRTTRAWLGHASALTFALLPSLSLPDSSVHSRPHKTSPSYKWLLNPFSFFSCFPPYEIKSDFFFLYEFKWLFISFSKKARSNCIKLRESFRNDAKWVIRHADIKWEGLQSTQNGKRHLERLFFMFQIIK